MFVQFFAPHGFRPVRLRSIPGVLAALLMVGICQGATTPPAVAHYNLGKDRLALGGYDPVAYFVSGQALKGRKEINSTHQGVSYWFVSVENKRRFEEMPSQYLPAYGGWCATAMAKGEKVEIDPTNFKVTDGRLFLFFKAFYGNALKDWNKDEPGLTTKADANWKKISGE